MANEPLDIDTLEMMLGIRGLTNEKEALRLLFVEVRRLRAELAQLAGPQIVIDSPLSALAAGVTAQQGRCLICNHYAARYCGLWCAENSAGRLSDANHGDCATCHAGPHLYCSVTCAAQGR